MKFKSILAVIAGVIAGGIIIAVLESLGHMIYPPPEGMDLKDPEAMKTLMSTIPLGAKIAVLIAWGFGTFGGGVTAIMLSERASKPAMFVALILLAMAVMTLFMFPHPLWMIIATPIVTLLGWYGATRFART